MSKTTQTTKPAAKNSKPARAPRASKGKSAAKPASVVLSDAAASVHLDAQDDAVLTAPEGTQGDNVTGFESHDAPISSTPSEAPAPAPVKSYALQLADALRARPQVSKDLDIAVSSIMQGQVALNMLQARAEWSDTCDKLVSLAQVGDKGDARFVAVKVWVKIVKMMQAMCAGIVGYADPYTRTICFNIASLSADGLTNKSALVSLSKHIEYDELEQQQTLVRKYNCSVGTASTQASSTRMMLRALNICEVTKNKNGDVIRTIAGNPRCEQMLALFATKPAD